MKGGIWKCCGWVWAVLAGCGHVPLRDVARQQRWWEGATPVSQEEVSALSSAYWEAADPGEHKAALIEVGDDALLLRVHLVRAARESIDIQTFIWKDDPVTRLLFGELAKAARRGVRIRLLIDGLNPVGDAGVLAEMAGTHPNLEVALYHPVQSRAVAGFRDFVPNLLFRSRGLNHRMHNKLFLVDGRLGIVGGRNYAAAYYDRDPGMVFKDREILVSGPTVPEMLRSFEAFWTHPWAVYLPQFPDVRAAGAKGRKALPGLTPGELAEWAGFLERAGREDPSAGSPELGLARVGELVFLADTPRKLHEGGDPRKDALAQGIVSLLDAARSHVLIQTPYLVFDETNQRRILAIRRRKPGIRVHVSTNSLASADHLHVYAISYKNRRELYFATGLEIHEFKPVPGEVLAMMPLYHRWGAVSPPRVCIHAKTLSVDGSAAKIGTHNFDPRSRTYNTECGILVRDPVLVGRIEASILRDMHPDNSWIVAAKANDKQALGRVNRLLGGFFSALPLFDVWPWASTTNYELREGAAALAGSRDPCFSERYRDVGQYPEVRDRLAPVFLHLFKAFGGWARPLM